MISGIGKNTKCEWQYLNSLDKISGQDYYANVGKCNRIYEHYPPPGGKISKREAWLFFVSEFKFFIWVLHLSEHI
jgi:hypothetical protein